MQLHFLFLFERSSMLKTHLPIIVCLILVMIIQFTTIWLPFNYFSNSSLNGHYLNLVNSDLKEFLIALLIFVIVVSVYYRFRHTHKELKFTVFICMFSPLIDFFKGLILILNTKNLFSPELSTFKWKTWTEYSSCMNYWHFFIIILVFSIFMISTLILIRYQKLNAK